MCKFYIVDSQWTSNFIKRGVIAVTFTSTKVQSVNKYLLNTTNVEVNYIFKNNQMKVQWSKFFCSVTVTVPSPSHP
jgi:hypothetical protein